MYFIDNRTGEDNQKVLGQLVEDKDKLAVLVHLIRLESRASGSVLDKFETLTKREISAFRASEDEGGNSSKDDKYF